MISFVAAYNPPLGYIKRSKYKESVYLQFDWFIDNKKTVMGMGHNVDRFSF